MGNFVLPTDPVAIAVLAVLLILFALWHYRKKMVAAITKKEAEQERKPQTHQDSLESADVATDEKKNINQTFASKSDILNTGDAKCICFRTIKGINVVDFTTISKAVGEMYMIDPSCPITGSGFIVREDEKGNIGDYDPREVPYKVADSPELAWFAISWDVVKRVFYTPLQWWKSPKVWFAGIMLGVLFIATLVVLGE